MIFGDQIDIDLKLNNPSLQLGKVRFNFENFARKVYEKAKIKINISVVAQEKKDQSITTKTLSGIENVIAISSGKGGLENRQ